MLSGVKTFYISPTISASAAGPTTPMDPATGLRSRNRTRNFQRLGISLSFPISRRALHTHAKRGRAPPQSSGKGGSAVLTTAKAQCPGNRGGGTLSKAECPGPGRAEKPLMEHVPGYAATQDTAVPQLPLSLSPPHLGSRAAPASPAKRPSKASWAITAKPVHLTSRYLLHLCSVPPAGTHAGPRLRGLSHKSPRALAPPPEPRRSVRRRSDTIRPPSPDGNSLEN